MTDPASPLRGLRVAMQLLTRIPVGIVASWRDDEVARSIAWFPAVGAVVGGLGAVAFAGGYAVGTALVGAVAAVATTGLVTGFFHEDGLADVADATVGTVSAERAHEILKDPRVGTYGASAIVLSALGRVALLAALAEAQGGAPWGALLAAHAVARVAPLWAARSARPAASGLGSTLVGAVPDGAVGAASLAGAVIAAVAVGGGGALAVLTSALGVALCGRAFFEKRLGGLTGDTLGAINQGAELTAYAALLALA